MQFFLALLAMLIMFVGMIGYPARRDFGDLCFGVAFALLSFWILRNGAAPGSIIMSLTFLMMALRSLCRAWKY